MLELQSHRQIPAFVQVPFQQLIHLYCPHNFQAKTLLHDPRPCHQQIHHSFPALQAVQCLVVVQVSTRPFCPARFQVKPPACCQVLLPVINLVRIQANTLPFSLACSQVLLPACSQVLLPANNLVRVQVSTPHNFLAKIPAMSPALAHQRCHQTFLVNLPPQVSLLMSILWSNH